MKDKNEKKCLHGTWLFSDSYNSIVLYQITIVITYLEARQLAVTMVTWLFIVILTH